MKMSNQTLKNILDETFQLSDKVIKETHADLKTREVGHVKFVGQGICQISGLPHVQADELVEFPHHEMGMVFNLEPNQVGAVLLDKGESINIGDQVRRTFEVMSTPVGKELMGRIVDAVGRPLDNRGSIQTREKWPIERPAPAVMDRDPVKVPLHTGIKAVDALIPIGRGQRELIVGDRQTGKTAIAVDTIINQHDKDVRCIYCAIGQKSSDVAKTVDEFRKNQAAENTIVVVADGEDPPGLKYITPYAAMTIGEYFMQQGEDVLVVFDDLTKHARAYRELSLLLRRPPAREAYPGDIFYIHSRLLERSTHLSSDKGGGSLTALPIVETQAQNISAYIPTNLISITDGQIYFSPELYHKGNLPAIEIGKSVSRVGGKTQLPAFRTVAGDLKLAYSQFQELEIFARFSTRLDEKTRQTLDRGRRIRELLKQSQYQPIPVPEQIAVLIALNEGIFDESPVDQVRTLEHKIRENIRQRVPDICQNILDGTEFSEQDQTKLLNAIKDIIDQQDDE
jgi:F-type H+-transporting ATPase subunit alpha